MQRMGAAVRAVDDAVALPHLRGPSPMPGDASPGQNEDNLLLAAVLVCRGRPPAGRDLDPAHADVHAARGVAQKCPMTAEVSEVAVERRSVVEVRQAHWADQASACPIRSA